MRARIEELAHELAQTRMTAGLFPQLERACRDVAVQRERIESMADSVANLRTRLAVAPSLGAPLRAAREALATRR